MSNERQPLRQLKRLEGLLVRLGRCPTCRGKLVSVPHEEIASWHHQPGGLGKFHSRHGFGARDGIMSGNITQLHHRKIPHCPGCHHAFIHGWIYPVEEQQHDENTE